MASGTDTIDITEVVEQMRSTFVLAAKAYIMGLLLAIPGVGPFAVWFIKVFGGAFINWLLNTLSNWGVMQAFFLNTAMRKASQAIGYTDKVKAKNNLPPTATDEEYEKAELEEIQAFNNLVLVTN